MFLARARLLKAVDIDKVRQAIAAAEHQTSGHVRVSLAPFFWGSVERAAERVLARIEGGGGAVGGGAGQRAAVLIFVVPARRRFVVLGDTEIHAKVGQEFWDHVSSAIAERFRAGDFTGGLLHGIETVGRELAEHFPYDAATAAAPDDVDIEP